MIWTAGGKASIRMVFEHTKLLVLPESYSNSNIYHNSKLSSGRGVRYIVVWIGNSKQIVGVPQIDETKFTFCH